MKTMKINENFGLKLNDDSESINVKIDNITKTVVDFKSDYTPITKENIQKLVDKLMRLEMITLQGDKNDVTEVDIVIWDIGEPYNSNELFIETYHVTKDEFGEYEISDDDWTMKYKDFLKK
jgi:hypothetical protein